MEFSKEAGRNVFIFWHQGFLVAPPIVQACKESWLAATRDSDWTVHLLSSENLDHYLQRMSVADRQALNWFQERLEPNNEHFSWTKFTDILRVCLLANFGGIWADSTVLALRPIKAWSDIDQGTDVYMPRGASSHEKLIENWLIFGRKGAPFLNEWKEKLIRALCYRPLSPAQNWNFKSRNVDYWLKRILNFHPRLSIYWFHPLVMKVLRKSPYFAAYYCFNEVLRANDLLEKSYLFTLPFDSDAWVQFNRLDWKADVPSALQTRLLNQDFIKLDWKRLQNEDLESLNRGILFQFLNAARFCE